MSAEDKFISNDPHEWIHPEDEKFVIEYGPYAGPLLTTDPDEIARLFIKHGVKRILYNGEVLRRSPLTLTSDIQTQLAVLISNITVISPRESQDSPLPPGSECTEAPSGTVINAGGADGNA